MHISLGAGLIASVWTCSYIIANSFLVTRDAAVIEGAVAVDFVLSATAIHWWLGIRKGGLPTWTAIIVAASGLQLAHWVVPNAINNAGLVVLVPVVLLEAAAAALGLVRIRTFRRAFVGQRLHGASRLDAFEHACKATAPFAPAIGRWARLEIEVWWLAVAGFFLKRSNYSCQVQFSHHREPAWFALALTLGFLLSVESLTVHLWLSTTNLVTLKWVALVLHAYSFVWLLGDAQALRLYPTRLDTRATKRVLRLQIGLRAQATIPLSAISDVTLGTWEDSETGASRACVIGSPNVLLDLKEPVILQRLFQKTAQVKKVFIQVDDASAFAESLKIALLEPRGRKSMAP